MCAAGHASVCRVCDTWHTVTRPRLPGSGALTVGTGGGGSWASLLLIDNLDHAVRRAPVGLDAVHALLCMRCAPLSVLRQCMLRAAIGGIPGAVPPYSPTATDYCSPCGGRGGDQQPGASPCTGRAGGAIVSGSHRCHACSKFAPVQVHQERLRGSQRDGAVRLRWPEAHHLAVL